MDTQRALFEAALFAEWYEDNAVSMALADTRSGAWKVWQAALASQAPAVQWEPVRSVLAEMTGDEPGAIREWWFDCDSHYIDVARSESGHYSILFVDRNTNVKSWLDQAELITAPPPQGDAIPFPKGWRLVEKKTCFVLIDGNSVIASLAGPESAENAAIIARAIDAARKEKGNV